MNRQRCRLLIAAAFALAVVCSTLPAADAGVQGFADLHSHLMAEHSFGGGWFWGYNEGPIHEAVHRCRGNIPFTGNRHGTTFLPVIGEMIGADTGWHFSKRNGYDTRRCRRIRFLWITIIVPGTCPDDHFKSWPRFDTVAHQQMWAGWMQDAYRGGMRLQVVSLDDSRFLCAMSAPESRRYPCDEMESIRRQAVLLQEYVARNAQWVGLARSPEEARSIIASGRLALVAAAELTELFPRDDFIAQLDEFYRLGIRSVQFVHHANNRFAGAAPITKLAHAAQLSEALLYGYPWTAIDNVMCGTIMAYQYPGCDGLLRLNPRGLTAEGEQLAHAMMARGMLVDVSHLSRRAFRGVYDISLQHGLYPLFYSHVHMWDTIKEYSGSDYLKRYKNEKYLLEEEIPMIVDTKGMIGLRTGGEDAYQYGTAVPHRCEGSSRSFAQSLMYAVDHKLNVGFGADLNGFIEQMKGRYRVGTNNCATDIWEIDTSPNRANWFQHAGLGHIGLLPSLMADLAQIGTPQQYLDHLNQSAEMFLQMWERGRQLAGVNVARDAVATASSTRCITPQQTPQDCYSPSRVNDGNRSVALGGLSSWTNSDQAPLPQWLTLSWAEPVSISRVVLYTTTGYEIRDFDIQVLLGNGSWATVAAVTNNTQAGPVPVNLSSTVQTTGLRVLGRLGPANQPNYVRINELEVYP